MFSWLRRKEDPQAPVPLGGAANPGRSARARIAFSKGDESWTEEVDIVEAAAEALARHEHRVTCQGTSLHHTDSDLVFQPLLVTFQPLDTGGVRTVTTIQTSHPELVPDGIFEFQHGAGETIEAALASGFDMWVKGDLIAFLEALREKPSQCTTLEMEFPAKEGRPAMRRRAVLGPVAHFMENSDAAAAPDASSQAEGAHPFCPCCLLTNTFEAFRLFLESDGFFGLRFFVARDERGRAQADCRVNGTDWKAGAKALRKYARTWPAAGYEFRKQYVLLQSLRSRPSS